MTTRDIEIGPMPSFVFLDAATGRIFTVNPGRERNFASGTYSVVEPGGQVKTMYLAGAMHATFSARWRTLAIARSGEKEITLVDADTLAQSTVALTLAPSALAISEPAGKVYAIAPTALTQAPYLVPGTSRGDLVEVDLRTRQVRIAGIEGFQPRHLLVDRAGTRVYAIGVNYFRTGEEMPGFVRAFDTTSLATVGPLLTVGRRPEIVGISTDDRSLFLISHMDWPRPEGTPFGRNIRAALYVVDTATVAVTRTIPMPDTIDFHLFTGIVQGRLVQGATPNTVYYLDQDQRRLVVVDIAAESYRETTLESFGRAVAYNPITNTVLVTFPRLGAVGVFSAAGDRLDTIPVGSPLPTTIGPVYNIAIDPRSGAAYVTNGHDGSISVIEPGSDPGAMVNMTDLWWNPAQGGWGVFIDQQGTTAFAALFTLDADGHPGWHVMSEGKRQGDGSFAGTLFRTTGPIATALENARAVGTMSIGAETNGRSQLHYVIDGKAVSSPIERQRFAAAERSCGWSVGRAKAANANYTSLWFDPAQPGWGIALSQQGDRAFGVVFSYDADNRASWATMSHGSLLGDGSLAGDLHRLASTKSVERVGSMAMRFGDANTATLSYEMKGLASTRTIGRQAFAPLVTDCASE